ncbi:MAG: hypothetical protein R2682_02295 [Pyrinomonadaceae bacterium]
MKLLAILLLALTATAFSQDVSEKDVTKVAEAADVIAIGEVSCVGEPPNVWSGTVLSAQKVRYRVVSILKGTISTAYIDVAHYVVNNSETADTKVPRLDRKLFTSGNRLILFLKEDTGKGYLYIPETEEHDRSKVQTFVSIDANVGAILSNGNNNSVVKRITLFSLPPVLGTYGNGDRKILSSFCDLSLSEQTKDGNITFTDSYAFRVGSDNSPKDIKPFKAKFTQLKDVEACLQDWKLVGFSSNSVFHVEFS